MQINKNKFPRLAAASRVGLIAVALHAAGRGVKGELHGKSDVENKCG